MDVQRGVIVQVVLVVAVVLVGCAGGDGSTAADGSDDEGAAAETATDDAVTDDAATDDAEAEPAAGGGAGATLTIEDRTWEFSLSFCRFDPGGNPAVAIEGSSTGDGGTYGLTVMRSSAVAGDGTNDNVELYEEGVIFARTTQLAQTEGSEELFAVDGESLSGSDIAFGYEDDATSRVTGSLEASCG